MKLLFTLMHEAHLENTPYRYWSFDLNGQIKNITIKFYPYGGKSAPQGGTFYLDKNGTPAACDFIRKNLKP